LIDKGNWRTTHFGLGMPTASHGSSMLSYSRNWASLGGFTVMRGGTLTVQ